MGIFCKALIEGLLEAPYRGGIAQLYIWHLVFVIQIWVVLFETFIEGISQSPHTEGHCEPLRNFEELFYTPIDSRFCKTPIQELNEMPRSPQKFMVANPSPFMRMGGSWVNFYNKISLLGIAYMGTGQVWCVSFQKNIFCSASN